MACGAFPLGRGENKITGIILTLMGVQICLHRYTLSRSFQPFPPLCDLLLMTHNTQHTNPCCFPRSFHVRLSSFLSRILTRCAPQTGMQRQLACGATLVAGNKHGHAKKTHKSKHNMPLLIDAAASITAGFCQSHFLCDLYTRCLCLVYPIIIHNNTSILHIFCSWHCQKCIGMISFIIH